MFKPTTNFKLRSLPSLDAETNFFVTIDLSIDVLAEVDLGWVSIKVFLADGETKTGFARKEWLESAVVNPDIDTQEFFTICIEAAKEYDTNAYYLMEIAQISSGLKNINPPGSSAVGPFQILEGTWKDYTADGKMGFSEADRYDPYSQPFVAARIAGEAMTALSTVLPENRLPTPAELYFANLFGVRGAQGVLAADRGASIGNTLQKVYQSIGDTPAHIQDVMTANKSWLADGTKSLTIQAALDKVAQSLDAALAKFYPKDVAALVNPNGSGSIEIVAMVKLANVTYWVIEKTESETGGEFLISKFANQAAQIIAQDTTVFPLKSGLVPDTVADTLTLANPNFDNVAGHADVLPGVPPIQSVQDLNRRVLSKAKECDGTLITRDVPNTRNGHLACAWAVNEVVRRALGKAIGGGLSTSDMFAFLKARHTPLSEDTLTEGAIIISPSQPGKMGHVGILGPSAVDPVVYANRSSLGKFAHFYTMKSWKAYFTGQLGLPVSFFALNKDAFTLDQPRPLGQPAPMPTGRRPKSASPPTDAAIVEAAKAFDFDPNTFRAIASIESSMDPQSNRNRRTQYKGLFQIGSEEWTTFGQGGDIYDAHDNAMAFGRMTRLHAGQFKSHFDRDPTDTELYLMHQQGLGFYTIGKMTNITGNPYPGMKGRQTHESFEAGWGRELMRRKAWFALIGA